MPEVYDTEKAVPLASGSAPSLEHEHELKYKAGFVGSSQRAMDFLVEHGVEERGIEPLGEDEREQLSWRTYLPQLAFWGALNTNILTFSEGMLGPAAFALDLKTAVLVIVFFNAVMCIPPAYLATNGPRTGMRQMVQARYSMGYFPVILIGLANCMTFVLFLSFMTILGGQCLSLASGSQMTWTVGIVVVSIIGLLLSFIGLRALHILSLTSLPIVLCLYVIIAGVTGDKLHLALNTTAQASAAVTAAGVLGYGASQIGFTVSYSGMASDYTSHLPVNTPRLPLFLCVYLGLSVPIICIQTLGAACYLAALSIPRWAAAAEIGAPQLLFAIAGESHAAKFVMVLLCLSTVANVAPTIYSCGLSGQVVFPFLIKVPRYFLALIVFAIYLPVSIVASTHFFLVLENFLGVLGYWTALYLPPALLEPILFRAPVNLVSYAQDIWNKPSKLPIGLAFIAGCCVGVPLVAASMSQAWWNGWIARKIGGAGDIAFELAFVAVTLVYIPIRYLERKHTGR